MMDTLVEPCHGPRLLLSRWRLDHVPDLILDNIMDHLAAEATRTHSCDKPTCGYHPQTSKPLLIPFTRELRMMSLVNHGFRENVLRRKIMDVVVLHTTEQVLLALSKIREESFGYIR
jgi:hypothetical protein